MYVLIRYYRVLNHCGLTEVISNFEKNQNIIDARFLTLDCKQMIELARALYSEK